MADLVRTADMKRVFSKRDSRSWSYKLCTITQIIDDTIPSYRIIYLTERYNEKTVQKSNFALKENDEVLKKHKILL